MKKLVITFVVLGTAMLSASSNSAGQTTPVWEVYLSGPVPSVGINPNATLVPGQSTPLSDLITFQDRTGAQCTLVPVGGGASLGTGTCNWANAVIFVNPGASYTLSGGYVYPPDSSTPGVNAGVLFGSGTNVLDLGLIPSDSQIMVTPDTNATGSISLGGGVGPATLSLSGNYYLTGGSGWGGSIPISNSCVPSASVAAAPAASASVLSASPASATAGSCNPPPPPPSQTCLNIIGNSFFSTYWDPNGRKSKDGKPRDMRAIFQPGGFLYYAAQTCGYSRFDWVQTVTWLPLPSPFYANIAPDVELHAPSNFIDPVPGSYTYDPIDKYNSNPFYCSTPTQCSTGSSFFLSFYDSPADDCLAGGNNVSCFGQTVSNPNASYIGFTTQLVGVLPPGYATPYVPLPASWAWKSTYNGNDGGISLATGASTANPSNGTGGVTITSVNGVSVTTLSSGQSCNGVFDGTFIGNVTVAAEQNCRFTNSCEIVGNVTVNGGRLDLECVVDGNLTASGGSLFLGGAAHVKGNAHIYQTSLFAANNTTIDGNLTIQSMAGSAQNTVCGAQIGRNLQAQTNASPIYIGGTTSSGCAGNAIGGNLQVQNNTAAVQVDSNTVNGNLLVDANNPTTDVSGNSVGGNMECENNATVTYLAVNTVKGNNQGQCAAGP